MRMLLAFLVGFLLHAPAGAQVPVDSTQAANGDTANEQRRVVLTSGTVLIGRVVDERDDVLVLRDADGLETTIPRDRIREVGPLLEGGYVRYDPAGTRLFVAPTGRSLGRGGGRISGYYLFPSVAFGISDRFDVSLGSSIPAPEIGTILAFNVKGQVFATEQLQVALGGNAFVPVGGAASLEGTAGTVYGVLTAGDPASAWTVGLFGVYASDFTDIDIGEGALVLVGYERQVSNSIKVLTENYIGIGEGDAFGTSLAGVRFFGDRLAADLAAALAWGGGGVQTVPIPYVGFSYTFGP